MTKKLEKDSIVFQEGDVADTAYFVMSGKIELSQTVRGQTQVIKQVGDNEVFGELAVFDPSALRPYTAKLLETSELVAVSAEEISALTAHASKPAQALLTLAFDKMKLGRSKNISKQNIAVGNAIKKLKIMPAGEKMTALFKPVEVPTSRLPFRIGGYPEGGEANRRDTVHLSLPVQANPLRVSRQHCEITFEENALVIVDLGSRFCTTVNDAIIGRGRGAYSAPLTVGENRVTLGGAEGDYTLTVTCE